MSETSALLCEGVSKSFGSTTAVDNISFHVDYGETLCLLGPNGAGKTTTIEMCEGFLTPASGSIRVVGMDPARHPDAVRARIGIMLQGGGSYSGISARDMLRLSASYNENPLDPEWLLDVLGLQGVARTSYRRLSGGQKQRLSLALAIVGKPELVFLDEPTAGMDAQSRIAVWELVSALKSDGVAVVLTTHLMDEAEALADRVIIMDHGSIVAEGTPGSLMANHRADTIKVVTSHPVHAAEFLEATGMELESSRPLHYSIHIEPTPAAVAKISHALAAQDVLALRLDTARSNLEDVFLDLTGRHLRS